MSQTVSVPGVGDLDFPDGMSQPDMAAAIKKNFPDIHPNPKQERKDAAVTRSKPKEVVDESLGGAAARTLGRIGHGQDEEGHGLAVGLGEAALGAASAIPAGLTGLAVAPFVGGEQAADTAKAMTYEPRTRSGKDVATLLTEPIKMAGEKLGDVFEKGAAWEAKKLGEIGGMPASPETQANFAAAGRTVGENIIPVAAAAAPLPKAAQGLMMGRTPSVGGAAGAAGYEGALAKDLPMAGKDYSPLREFTPEQEARYNQLKNYKPTLGQVTRNAAQMTFEEQEALRAGAKPPKAKVGVDEKPTIEETRSDLNEQLADQNKKLADNLRALSTKKGPTKPEDLGTLIQTSAETKRLANAKALSEDLDRLSGHPDPTVSDSQIGAAVQKSAGTKLQARKNDVKRLYNDATASEGLKKAPVKALDDYFAEHKTEEINNPALDSLHAKWNEIKPKPKAAPPTPPAILDASGKPIRTQTPATPPAEMTIGDLDQLYKAAGRAGKPMDPATMRVANEIKDIIRGLQDTHGGPKYKEARAMRNQQGLEFEEQGGVNRVVAEATRTDMKVDASQLPEKVLKGTREDLAQTLNTLGRDVRPGNKATAAQDSVAIAGLRQKAINMIKEKGIDAIPKENLDQLFSKGTADKIRKTVADAEAKTKAETSHADKSIDPSLLPDKIIHGTEEDLKRTMATLQRSVRSGTETTRMADQGAIDGLRQHAVNTILEDASGAIDAKGRRSISPVAFERAVDKIGRENLEVLFDKKTADAMYQLVKDAELLKTKPSKAGGSPTASNLQVILDKDFTNRAAYLMENVARKFSGSMVMGSIRWAREAAAGFAKSAHELENALESRHPTRASAADTEALAKPVRREVRQIRMGEAKAAARGPTAVALTMDKKSKKDKEATP